MTTIVCGLFAEALRILTSHRFVVVVSELARHHRTSTMYGNGLAPVWSRNDYSLFQMGEGAKTATHTLAIPRGC